MPDRIFVYDDSKYTDSNTSEINAVGALLKRHSSEDIEYISMDAMTDFVNWIPDHIKYRSTISKVDANVLWIEYLAEQQYNLNKSCKK